jgi:hypothetical protein
MFRKGSVQILRGREARGVVGSFDLKSERGVAICHLQVKRPRLRRGGGFSRGPLSCFGADEISPVLVLHQLHPTCVVGNDLPRASPRPR